MGKGRKRRTWSDEEKRSVCQQTAAPGVSVAQVARRYAMNANLIFKWLKDPRFAPDENKTGPEPVFLPVEIDPSELRSEPPRPAPARVATNPGGRIEIELNGGHRISAEGGFDPDVLARLLKGLMA
jgi:transposase